MKKIYWALTMALLTCTWLLAQETTAPAIVAPAPVVVSLDTQVVGGQTFYVVADQLDSILSNVRVIVSPIAENPPQSGQDWFILILKLLSSGVLASLTAQGVKVWKTAKELFSGLRNEWIVLIVSGMVGAAWLYFETQFQNFAFTPLFFKTASVFTVAMIAWRAGLSRLFQKKETAPAPTPTA